MKQPMMTFPATYWPFVASELSAIATRIEHDQKRRADDDERIRALATIPDNQLDASATGTLLLSLEHKDPAS